MPIYHYICEACNDTYEALQKMSDAALTVCPHCGEEKLKKQLSAPSFRLKGGGWYETDFKSGNKKNVADSGDKKESASKTAHGCAAGACGCG